MRILALILMAVVTPRPILAQVDSSNAAVTTLSSLHEKDAIQVTLVNNISAAYRWRAFVDFPLRARLDLRFTAEDQRNSNEPASSTYATHEDVQVFQTGVGLTLQYLTTLKQVDPVQIYLGLGPYLTVDYSFVKSRMSYDPPQSQPSNEHQSTTSTWWVGAVASIGLECQLHRNVTMLAEYNLTGTYSRYVYEPFSESKYRRQSWRLALSSINIGLGVYL